MILRDWREADPALLRACYDIERRSWREDLGWDTEWTWATIEHARVTWGLPGLLAFDHHGTLQGWAFHMRDGATLHLGGLVASSAAVTAALLDAVLETARPSETVACFIRHRAPGIESALVATGFDVERFLYLSRPLTPADAPYEVPGCSRASSPVDRWRHSDIPGAAALLQDAYPEETGRHFAPSGTIEEWSRYVAGVAAQRGCGMLDPEATRVARTATGIEALALITSLSRETAHLAQLAVHAGARGRGVGSTLLQDAMTRAARAGKTAFTLLVGERNISARRLYAPMGLEERGLFVAARGRNVNAASRVTSQKLRSAV